MFNVPNKTGAKIVQQFNEYSEAYIGREEFEVEEHTKDDALEIWIEQYLKKEYPSNDFEITMWVNGKIQIEAFRWPTRKMV